MLISLRNKYFTDLMESLTEYSTKVSESTDCSETNALLFGNGRPVYLTSSSVDEVRVTYSNMKLERFQKLLEVYEVNPDNYSYDPDLFTVKASNKSIKIIPSLDLKGSIKLSTSLKAKEIKEGCFLRTAGRVSHNVVLINEEGAETLHKIDYIAEPKYSLLDLAEILIDCIQEDTFYGITSTIGDQILHISHPMVLSNLLKVIEDPEERIFDNTWLYKFKNPLSPNLITLDMWDSKYQELSTILEHANENTYSFKASRKKGRIHIVESYNDSLNFYATVPVQTAYSGNVSFPYYGVEIVHLERDDPRGTPFWPITSPNVDTYNTWEVCTGTKVKTLEGVSMLFNGNFASTFPTSNCEGTFRAGWREAILVMISRTKVLLNKELDACIPDSLPKLNVIKDVCESLSGDLTKDNLNVWGALLKLVNDYDNTSLADLEIDIKYIEEYIDRTDSYLSGRLGEPEGTALKVLNTGKLAKRILAAMLHK